MPTPGWSDFLRLPWAHLCWNWRKSRWLARGRSGHCPCLNPSDPQGPGQARCEAVIHWRNPARFRRVCPLLEQRKGEWRCSAGRKGVRTYWGRAASYHLTRLAILLIVVVAGVQTLLWRTGVRGVTPLDIVNPSRWQHVRDARADAFRRLAVAAMRSGDFPTALLALATAEDTAPGTNLETGLLTLRLAENGGQYAVADKLHRKLASLYPNDRLIVSITYRDALLISGRWQNLAELCLEEISADSPEPGPWLRSFALAADRLDNPPAFAAAKADFINKPPPPWPAALFRLLDDRTATTDYPPEVRVLFASVMVEHAARVGDAVLAAEAFGQLATMPDTFRDLRLQHRYRLRFGSTSRDPYAIRDTLVDYAGNIASLQLLIADALRAGDTRWLAAIASRLPAQLPADCAGDLWLCARILGDDDLRVRAEASLISAKQVSADYFALAKSDSPGADGWTDWITRIPCSREMLFTLAELRPLAQSSAR